MVSELWRGAALMLLAPVLWHCLVFEIGFGHQREACDSSGCGIQRYGRSRGGITPGCRGLDFPRLCRSPHRKHNASLQLLWSPNGPHGCEQARCKGLGMLGMWCRARPRCKRGRKHPLCRAQVSTLPSLPTKAASVSSRARTDQLFAEDRARTDKLIEEGQARTNHLIAEDQARTEKLIAKQQAHDAQAEARTDAKFNQLRSLLLNRSQKP